MTPTAPPRRPPRSRGDAHLAGSRHEPPRPRSHVGCQPSDSCGAEPRRFPCGPFGHLRTRLLSGSATNSGTSAEASHYLKTGPPAPRQRLRETDRQLQRRRFQYGRRASLARPHHSRADQPLADSRFVSRRCRHQSCDRRTPVEDLDLAAATNLAEIARQVGFQFRNRCGSHGDQYGLCLKVMQVTCRASGSSLADWRAGDGGYPPGVGAESTTRSMVERR